MQYNLANRYAGIGCFEDRIEEDSHIPCMTTERQTCVLGPEAIPIYVGFTPALPCFCM